MKLTRGRPFADPEKAARRLMEHARAFKPVQDGRVDIDVIHHPFLFVDKATPAEYSAGLAFAIKCGWITMHESGTYLRFEQAATCPE
jgi:hypothetical protein